ncbi:MAG: hypothetical protein ACUVQZ_10010 [Candidatus Caldatribacteriaceae bacterium]
MSFSVGGQEVIGRFFVEKSYQISLRFYKFIRWIFSLFLWGWFCLAFFEPVSDRIDFKTSGIS